MSITDAGGRAEARLALVEEHVSLENRHDLDGIMGTFGASPRYDEEPWNDHHIGRDAVRAYYDGLLRAMPDLAIDVRRRHVAEDAVVLEVLISGRHLGPWRGLPPTGRPVRFPLCGIFTFDREDRLAGEKIYYDRATVLQQLGVFHDPDGMIGRIEVMVMHPLTMAQAIGRRILQHRKSPPHRQPI
ncbi:MAG: ester cyclase [Xanthobacteraceae bacterium]